MRGRPVPRTILAWICIFSLAIAGCATNRTEARKEGSKPENLHVLAVIPTGGGPEINVVRTGNSRLLGALRGAGRGFLKGVEAIAQGAGGVGNCSGEGCAVVAAALVVLTVTAGTVGAVIGGVKGSRVPAPYEQVSDPDDATRKRLLSLRIQEGIAKLVEDDAGRNLAIPVSLEEPPPRESDDRDGMHRRLKASGFDAALRVGITRVGFEGPVGKDPPASVVITLHAEIARTANGEKVFEETIEHRSAAMPAGDWVKDDFLRLTRELDDGIRDLARRCVEDIRESGLVSPPLHDDTRPDPRPAPER